MEEEQVFEVRDRRARFEETPPPEPIREGQKPASGVRPAPKPVVQAGEPESAEQSGEPEPAAQLGEPEPAAQLGEPEPAAQLGEPEPAAQLGEPEPAAQLGEPEPAAQSGEEVEVNFASFILSLATSALHFLGAGEDGGSASPQSARQMIDILALLQQKTQGNLTQDEGKLLSDILYNLRMKFVEVERKPRLTV